MQGDKSFKILSKEVSKSNSQPICKFQEIVFELTKENGQVMKHSGIIGKNQLSCEIEKVLLQMKKGQKWVIQDSSNVKYSIEIIQLGPVQEQTQSYDRAEFLKGEGNAAIKSKDNRTAIQKYTQAYDLLINDSSSRSQDLKISIMGNLALATLNIGDFNATLKWCDIHLQESYEPNLKVVYRKASANKGLKNWEKAKEDIEFGLRQNPDEQTVGNFKKLLSMLQEEQKQQKKKEKAVYGKMFG